MEDRVNRHGAEKAHHAHYKADIKQVRSHNISHRDIAFSSGGSHGRGGQFRQAGTQGHHRYSDEGLRKADGCGHGNGLLYHESGTQGEHGDTRDDVYRVFHQQAGGDILLALSAGFILGRSNAVYQEKGQQSQENAPVKSSH